MPDATANLQVIPAHTNFLSRLRKILSHDIHNKTAVLTISLPAYALIQPKGNNFQDQESS